MMSLETIRSMSREQAAKARKERREPFTVETEDIADWKYQLQRNALRLPFPNIGTYVPAGWKRTDREPLFVDKTGWGDDDEPAMSIKQLLNALTPGKAYAITEEGQFQLYISEFEQK